MLNGNSMIYKKNHKQMQIVDPWSHLSPRRRKRLETEWPGLFQKNILMELPVDELSASFHGTFGAPTKELYAILGALLLQQMKDLTDREAIDQLAFNTQWHFALNIPEESDKIKSVGEKTWWSMRQLATEKHLDQLIFNRVAVKLAKVFKVNKHDQRIDSVHIKSNMRKLSRLGIFSQTIHRFLVNLKRHHRSHFDTIDKKIRSRYFKKKALNLFAMVKPSQSSKTLATVSSDLYDLIGQFKDHAAICNMSSYKQMQRVLSDQCNVEPGPDRRVTVKKPKGIPSDSLQNPSDPDAGYSGHKGQGYQVQIMETYTPTPNKEEGEDAKKKPTLNLITHVAVERACDHDNHALLPAMEDADDKGLKPTTVLADALYGSDDNVTDAADQKVEIISPVMKGGQSKEIHLDDFSFDESGRVTRCPEGHGPAIVSYKKKKGRYSAGFQLDHCRDCPCVSQCPVQTGMKYYYLRYGSKDIRLARRRKHEATDEFKDRYRWRAGVEATMSQLDRLTGIKHQRVRGMPAVRFGSTLKAAGVNILRAAVVYKAMKRRMGTCFARSSQLFPFFKERMLASLPTFNLFYYQQPNIADSYSKSAA